MSNQKLSKCLTKVDTSLLTSYILDFLYIIADYGNKAYYK